MSAVKERSLDERIRRMTPVSAPPDQRADVVALSRLLLAHGRNPDYRLVGPTGDSIPIPEAAFHVFERVAEVLARGDAITIVPVGKEMTTQQAADVLNVSRQYLVRLLDQGEIPFSKTGTHRRLKFEDVLAYKEQRDRERRATLEELTRIGQELGDYDDLK